MSVDESDSSLLLCGTGGAQKSSNAAVAGQSMTADSSILTSQIVSPRVQPYANLPLGKMFQNPLHSRTNSGLGLTGREALLMSEPDDDAPSCSDNECRCKKTPRPSTKTDTGSPLRKLVINRDELESSPIANLD